MARSQLAKEQIAEIERTRLERLRQPPADELHAMLILLARVVGLGVETADMLVHEVLVRHLRDRQAVGRYGGITGAPDESGARRRQKAWHAPATPGYAAACCNWPGGLYASKRRAPWSNGFTRAPPTAVPTPASG
jgi:hypothetical protein